MTNSAGVPARSGGRRLGLRQCVTLGLSSMVGAGLFTVFAPAAAAAGSWLPLAVLIASLVAAASAHSMVRLAARHPGSGGVYVYGRERLGVPWGYLAGWSFVSGKTASCAVMALALGVHLWPDATKVVAILVVLVMLALNLQGVHRSELVSRTAVVAVIVLGVVLSLVMLAIQPVTTDDHPPAPADSGGIAVIGAAGLIFFALVGFARLAPMGDAVEDAGRTIPRAIALGLVVVVSLYLLVAFALTDTLGAGWVAAREAPLAEAAEISAWPWLGPVLRVAAVLVAGGALHALTEGVARIVLAMARDRHLPTALSHVEGSRGTPRRAQAVITAAVIIIVVLVDLREAIGLAAFLALAYYAIGHACAWTLDRRPVQRLVPALGLVGCVALALLLPWESVAAGIVILAFGAFTGWVRWTTREGRPE